MRAPLALVLAVSACASGSHGGAAPDARPPAPSLCDRYQADAARPAYSTVQQIFDENCNGCHTALADLPLTPGPAWPRLVDQPAPVAEACGGILVQPGAPDASYLYQKVSSDAPCSGSRMPRGDFGPAPLPDCVVMLIRTWILQGAVGPQGAVVDAGVADAGDARP